MMLQIVVTRFGGFGGGEKIVYIMEVSDKRLEQDYHPYHIPIYTSRFLGWRSVPLPNPHFPRFHIGPD